MVSHDFKFPNLVNTKLGKGRKRKRPLVIVFLAPSEMEIGATRNRVPRTAL